MSYFWSQPPSLKYAHATYSALNPTNSSSNEKGRAEAHFEYYKGYSRKYGTCNKEGNWVRLNKKSADGSVSEFRQLLNYERIKCVNLQVSEKPKKEETARSGKEGWTFKEKWAAMGAGKESQVLARAWKSIERGKD